MLAVLLTAPGGSKLVKTPFLDTTKLWFVVAYDALSLLHKAHRHRPPTVRNRGLGMRQDSRTGEGESRAWPNDKARQPSLNVIP